MKNLKIIKQKHLKTVNKIESTIPQKKLEKSENFDSALCTYVIKMGGKLRGGGLHIPSWEKSQ